MSWIKKQGGSSGGASRFGGGAKKKEDDRLKDTKQVAVMAWNSDFSMVAVAPANDSGEIHIYFAQGEVCNKWVRKHTLSEHDFAVSGLDWSPVTNKLVSCGHDRNAYVWTQDSGTWKPELVILRVNRAATKVKWSPNGDKFACATGAKQVPVCHYEEGPNWWVSKMIKKHKSTILDIDWHPNNKFLITGGCDYKCRVVSAFINECDTKDDEENFAGVWKDQFSFGTVLATFDCGKGWIEGVAWSPSGWRAAFTAHDSSVSFVQILAEGAEVESYKTKDLPYRSVVFLTDDLVAFAGHDFKPILWNATGDEANPQWKFQKALDGGEKKKAAPKKTGGFSNARAMFAQADSQGTTFGKKKAETLNTKHQNQIVSLSRKSESKIVSAGLDGRVFFWDI